MASSAQVLTMSAGAGPAVAAIAAMGCSWCYRAREWRSTVAGGSGTVVCAVLVNP